MVDTADLLVELGTEELPPKALPALIEAFTEGLVAALQGATLALSDYQSFATPRRLGLLVRNLDMRQPDRSLERRGPSLKAAFDPQGDFTRAAEGFARSCGVTVDQLETHTTDRGSWLVYRTIQPGLTAAGIVPKVLAQVLADLPIPKRMRWGDGNGEFVRPVHWVVLLLADQVVSTTVFNVRSGRETRGHRFHHPAPLSLAHARDYEPRLRDEGHVIASFAHRRDAILRQVLSAAAALDGDAVIDPQLLDEVTALVEWPVAVTGGFESRFLSMPKEVLISTLQDHQKYFPVIDAQGRLLPNFVTISNIDSLDPDLVRQGNERVVRPRLADAEFFWNQDIRIKLAQRRSSLAQVTFQHHLGSLLDKTQRIAAVATEIAVSIGLPTEDLQRAAALCKCDLLTLMVNEFPDLQGIMGRHYADHDGESNETAKAIEQHYWPRFSGDQIPVSLPARLLALADRLDTLLGIFAIGEHPTGNRDPFALRRSALGVLRILIEGELPLDLGQLLHHAAAQYPAELGALSAIDSVREFMLDRLQAYYHERGYKPDEFDAIQCLLPSKPLDFDTRLKALAAFRQLEEAESLETANKRIRNILRRNIEPLPDLVNAELLFESAEQQLATTVAQVASEAIPLMDASQYQEALVRLARLREPVDRFFDQVMVMTDQKDLRLNRLALLNQLESLFMRVADLSRLQPRVQPAN